jgi:pyruvate carboxylase
MRQIKLHQLRKQVEFLKLIPDSIYFNLDPDEFYIPETDISRLRKELEQKLGHYVMTYNRDVFKKHISPDKHLCAHLKGAKLNKQKRLLLEEYEQKVRDQNISFVVYKKPLQFINPSKSAVSKILHMPLCRTKTK